MGDEDDTTQGVSDARDTRDLVFSLLLTLAARVLEFVDRHEEEGIGTVWLEEEHPSGGFVWLIRAGYSPGSSFVQVVATPSMGDGPRVLSIDDYAQAIGNEHAKVNTAVPRAWVELAAAAAAMPAVPK